MVGITKVKRVYLSGIDEVWHIQSPKFPTWEFRMALEAERMAGIEHYPSKIGYRTIMLGRQRTLRYLTSYGQ